MATLLGSTRFDDLLKLLDKLESLHEQLHQRIRAKLEAMRKNDVKAMRDATEEEERLAQQIREREGFRRQLVEAIGREAGWPAPATRDLPASQLLSRLAEPQRSAFEASLQKLRKRVARVAEANRLVGAVARGTLEHLSWVFAAVRGGHDRPVGYSHRGASVATSQLKILDAVG